ncbi:MAG: hypothetical protein OEM62_12400, partial [Acidobacteriota bacterium]|nr:hypothetical protein [Acidobacteriota bacterium]
SLEPERLPRGDFTSEVEIPPFLLSPGEYWIDLGGRDLDTREWTWGRDQLRFVVLEEWSPEYDTTDSMGLVNLTNAGRRTSRPSPPDDGADDEPGG